MIEFLIGGTDIRSLYPKDWNNFLERMAGWDANNLRGIPHALVNEEDFCEKGALSHLARELQQWAAYRGQQLSRTVRGVLLIHRLLRQYNCTTGLVKKCSSVFVSRKSLVQS